MKGSQPTGATGAYDNIAKFRLIKICFGFILLLKEKKDGKKSKAREKESKQDAQNCESPLGFLNLIPTQDFPLSFLF